MKLKTNTLIVIAALMIAFPTFLNAEERWPARLTMDDLTNPSSPSYVPYPFPDTREKIIANLKYQISKRFGEKSWRVELKKSINLLQELIKPEPGAIIEAIVKIKNRIPHMSKSYSYLIIISDLKGKYISRVAMKANGLLGGWTDPSITEPGFKLKKFDHVIKKMERHFKKEHVLSIERIAYGLLFADITHPIYEISLRDGSKYYYDHRGKAYKKGEVKSFEGTLRSPEGSFFLKSQKKKLKRNEKYLVDMIDQRFIVLTKLN